MRLIRLLVSLAALAMVVAAPAGARSSAAPVNASAPTIEGKPVVGGTVSAGNGGWSNTPTSFTYQWLRCDSKGAQCVPISGAKERSYTIASADLGRTLVVYVSARNADGETGPINSKPSAVVSAAAAPQNTTPPAISGRPIVGEQLVADPGKYAGGVPERFSFQWQRCNESGTACTNVAGSTGQAYGVRAADVGGTLRVQVRATNDYGSDVTTSDRTVAVKAAEVPVVRTTTTLESDRDETTCCQTVRLTGTISSTKAGETIRVLAREFGDIAAFPVATATTGAGGTWSAVVRPEVETVYTASTATTTSTPHVVAVHPRVGLGFQRGVFSTKVTGASSFAGKVVFFQRQAANSRWVTLQRVVLDVNSVARFNAKLPKGVSVVRAYISRAQAGEGFLEGTSQTRRFTRR
jgi:hypothetical protein